MLAEDRPRAAGRLDVAGGATVYWEEWGHPDGVPALYLHDPHLVADLEQVRTHLGIDSWLVNGASWGSTLALAYARSHPERVRGLALWEDTHVSIGTGGLHRDPRWDDARFRHAFVRLTTHYWSHDAFCDPPVLEDVEALAGIPAVLIHGRRDISSPMVTAWRLHRSWPGSRLVVDEGDGHGGASMAQRWREANDELLLLAGD